MSKEDFILWKKDPMTDSFFRVMSDRREDVIASLVSTAGSDSIIDAVKRGYCQAIVDMLSIDYEETVDGN